MPGAAWRAYVLAMKSLSRRPREHGGNGGVWGETMGLDVCERSRYLRSTYVLLRATNELALTCFIPRHWTQDPRRLMA